VEDAVADVGIVGENVFYEKNKKAEIVELLGFANAGYPSLLAEASSMTVWNSSMERR